MLSKILIMVGLTTKDLGRTIWVTRVSMEMCGQDVRVWIAVSDYKVKVALQAIAELAA